MTVTSSSSSAVVHPVSLAAYTWNLVANYENAELREQYTREVDHAERSADRVTHDVNRLIHKTFITPIDRDQIHKLINTMDDVADLLQDSAETMSLYDLRKVNEEIMRLTDLSVKCVERMKEAVGAPRKARPSAASSIAARTRSNRIHRPGIATRARATRQAFRPGADCQT